jgi:hypothetical protein
MRRIILGVSVLGLVINTSCKKCKECHYTYSKSEIVQTPNGEETVVTTGIVGYVVNDDGETFSQECIKNDESFTIVTAYESEEASTTLSDFEFDCVVP